MSTGRVLGIGARLSKLRAMSPAEILHRLRYKGVLAQERRQYRSKRLALPGRLRQALAPPLAGREWPAALLAARRDASKRFFPGTADRDAMRALFTHHHAGELADTIAKAADARQHRFTFFGQTFVYGDAIPWQADPVTGKDWPRVFHADVPVHGGNVGYGDVKHVWELSRHQFLIDLGKSWFLTGNPDDLRALQRLVRSWIDDNPYGTGVNWSCALEPAFRVFSWLWAYHLTADALDDDLHLSWLEAFHDHGRFIERHFEHYASPYNHLIGEAAALYMLASFFPEFSDSPRWRATATKVLETRLGEQFYADGGTVEQSTFYHHATVGFYLLAGLTARVTGDDLPRPIWNAIERGLEFSLALTQPDGFTPSIGGADDGKPIRMEHLPFWDFRPYLALGAVIFERGDFKTVAGRFHEDALWLLGPSGRQRFDAIPGAPPRHVSEARISSGYYVLRSGWSADADYVCFDCGEQAAGMRTDAVPNSMHGHADCLSIVAWLAGRRVLVDSGLYSYNAGGEWEAHFRETAAHNTARIDGRDQARHIGKMAWSNSYRAAPEGWHTGGRHGWVVGSHDGYARGADGVRHRRTVWLRHSGVLVVYDEFEGQGTHALEVNYQFAPGTLRETAAGVRFEDAVDLAWAGTVKWTAACSHGGDSPASGWIAPSLGVRVPAPRLTLTAAMEHPYVNLLTVLTPGDASSVTRLDAGPSGGILVAVTAPEFTDIIAAAAGADAGPFKTDARLVACRLGGETPEVDRIGGTHLDLDITGLRRILANGASRETSA